MKIDSQLFHETAIRTLRKPWPERAATWSARSLLPPSDGIAGEIAARIEKRVHGPNALPILELETTHALQRTALAAVVSRQFSACHAQAQSLSFAALAQQQITTTADYGSLVSRYIW